MKEMPLRKEKKRVREACKTAGKKKEKAGKLGFVLCYNLEI